MAFRTLNFSILIGKTNAGAMLLPVDVAFEVVVLVDGREHEVDTLLVKAEANTIRSFNLDVDRLDDRLVTIQLRPNPEAARATVDYFEIWGEPIIYENVEFLDGR